MVSHPWIATLESSPNFTVPVTSSSSSEKDALEPIMWLLAQESRYHRCSWSAPTRPRWTWARGSSRLTVFRAFPGHSTIVAFPLLGLDVVQCTERHHQDSGLIIIISLRQMSLRLLLLLLLRRSLAGALAIATAAGGGCLPRVPPSSPLLLCQ